ncbi:MAG: hypothetical protein IJ343_14150 [Clostridia bacterium]|nr:hypothetical protein [Clostridia bacterium]
MANKKAAPVRDEKRAAADYYKLNRQAVEDLVTADESNSPVVSEEELSKYRSRSGIKLADWLKIVLIKTWFYGAVCFFFMWGLSIYLPNIIDQIFVTGMALGFVNDLLVGNLLRFMEKTPGANARWMMFPKKGYVSLPLNIVYAYVLMFLVVQTYEVINGLIALITGVTDKVHLGVEPILFGVFVMIWDVVLLKMKHLFRQIVTDAKKKAHEGR